MQIEQVMVVLGEIGAQDLPILEVYNKLDLLEGVEPQIQRDENGKPQRVRTAASYQARGLSGPPITLASSCPPLRQADKALAANGL